MAPTRSNLTAEQTTDANLWLHKKDKMEFDGASTNFDSQVQSMGNQGDPNEDRAKNGRNQPGDFGLGKADNRFACPDGFTISMLIKPDDLTKGDSALIDMRMSNAKNSWKQRHHLRMFLGGEQGALSGSQYFGIAAGCQPNGGGYSNKKFQLWDQPATSRTEFLLTFVWHYHSKRDSKDTYSANSDGWITVYINDQLKDEGEFRNKYNVQPFSDNTTSNQKANNLVCAAIPFSGNHTATNADELRNYDNSVGKGVRILDGSIRDFRFYGIPFNDTQVENLYSGIAGPFPPTTRDFSLDVIWNTTTPILYTLSDYVTPGTNSQGLRYTMMPPENSLPGSGAQPRRAVSVTKDTGFSYNSTSTNYKGTHTTNFFAVDPAMNINGGTQGKSNVSTITFNVIEQQVPATGSVYIVGDYEVKSKLTAALVGIQDSNRIVGNYTYKWMDSATKTELTGANNSFEYTVQAGDIGKEIEVEVSFNDGLNNKETILSTKTSKIRTPIIAEENINKVRQLQPNSNWGQTIAEAMQKVIDDAKNDLKPMQRRKKRLGRHTLLKTVLEGISTNAKKGVSKKTYGATFDDIAFRYDKLTIQKVPPSNQNQHLLPQNLISPKPRESIYVPITEIGDKVAFKLRNNKIVIFEVLQKASEEQDATYGVTVDGVVVRNITQNNALTDGQVYSLYNEKFFMGGVGNDGFEPPPTRSVAKADVAELTAALDSSVTTEDEHHLIIVSTNKVISTTQFKQMFYSRGDDFFQIANVYECPDSCDSIHSSVWGIDCQDPHASSLPNAAGLITMGGNRLTASNSGYSGGYSIATQQCFNFNKLGGRENDPPGCAWAYSYVHDQSRNFYAQHEVMGYLEKDTCVKRDFWTACSRMSIEDQLYGLAFASETDQDLCMKVTCARRWSEVEDALAESCTAANKIINKPVNYTFTLADIKMGWDGNQQGRTYMISGRSLTIQSRQNGVVIDGQVLRYVAGANQNGDQVKAEMTEAAAAIKAYRATGATTVGSWRMTTTGGRDTATHTTANHKLTLSRGYMLESTTFTDPDAMVMDTLVLSAETVIVGQGLGRSFVTHDGTSAVEAAVEYKTSVAVGRPFVDLYINVRVTNGHPKALDTILRVRFTVVYTDHEPSALNTWNTRASTAASGVINSGVVGDAPEGGKQQSEDTTVVN